MEHGDFTELAKYYVDRPGYSLDVLKVLRDHVAQERGMERVQAADVGAGTGKLTEGLRELGVSGYAVEPNGAMRQEGARLFANDTSFQWMEGAAEATGLPDHCVDWVLMGSSFHWADAPRAMGEFHRVLRPGGFFTAIWNPRDIKASRLHTGIEGIVYGELPGMERVSSGRTLTTAAMAGKMCGTGLFSHMVYVEAPHSETMPTERYMNIWRPVNDIRVQAGEEGFRRLLGKIGDRVAGLGEITVPYLSRSWTVQAVG